METLQITYKAAQNDIQEAWNNPARSTDRITRDWIYSVDPETMNFVKAIFKVMPGHFSLYKTFVAIMKTGSLIQLLNNNK